MSSTQAQKNSQTYGGNIRKSASNAKKSESANQRKKILYHEHLIENDLSEKGEKNQKVKSPDPKPSEQGKKVEDSKEKQKNKVAEEEFSKKFKRMYQFPASVSEALVHRRAYRNGYKASTTLFKEMDTKICPCCENFVNTIEVPLCESTQPKKQYKTSGQIKDNKIFSENAFLFTGGDALFFCFIKLVIKFLLLRLLILDLFNLYTNFMGNYCQTYRINLGQKDLCQNWFVSIFSTYNNATAQGQTFLVSLDLISLVVTIVSILFCLYGRVKLYELYWFLEREDKTEDDYTILIQDIPSIPFLGNDSLVKDVNQEYKNFIEKLVSNKIRVWLNSLYSYSKIDQVEEKQDKQFYKIFSQKKDKQNESELFQNIVANISLCYDLTELQNLENIRQSLVQNFLQEEADKQAIENSLFDDQHLGKNEFERAYVAHLPHQIEIINQHYVRLCQKISDVIVLGNEETNTSKLQRKQSLPDSSNKKSVDELKISRFVGKAFVSFQYQHFKRYLLQKHADDKDYLKVNGNTIRLTLSHAQKPNDVYWKNMKISDDFRRVQIRNSYILVFVGLLVSTTIMYILRSIQSSIVNNNIQQRSTLDTIILYSIPLWTFLVNNILDWGIFQLTKSEKHKTKTEELTSLIIKNTAAKFINTSVIYALIFIFGERINPMKQNGLVKTVFDLVCVNAALNILFQILQPGWIYNNFKNRKYLKNHPDGEQIKVNVFQIKLNKMLEMPTFDFAQAYSYYLQMIYICSFYGFLIPAITPILIIVFFLQYWIDKQNLLKRSSSPVDMGYFLTKLIWTCFQMSLVLFVLGHLVWGSFFYQQNNITTKIFNYTNLTFAVVYALLVLSFPEKIQKFTNIVSNQSDLSKQSYNNTYKKFQKTYRAQNPATSFLDQKVVNNSYSAPQVFKQTKQKVENLSQPEQEKQKLKSLHYAPPADSDQNIQILQDIYKYRKSYSTALCSAAGE